jgi:hypothetical protein
VLPAHLVIPLVKGIVDRPQTLFKSLTVGHCDSPQPEDGPCGALQQMIWVPSLCLAVKMQPMCVSNGQVKPRTPLSVSARR